MSIIRHEFTETGPRMSRFVVYGGVVHMCFVAEHASRDVKDQTRQVLARIDRYLALAGTTKSKLLTAQIWIKDMALFNDMNKVWNAWVDSENPPVRACVRANLARPELLIEIKVSAAM